MAKLQLNPAPTFTAKVLIPIPGGEPVPVEFTFRHRDKAGLDKYLEELKALAGEDPVSSNVTGVMKAATAWELDDPFNEESVRLLVSNYHRAGWEIAQTYISELMQAKTKN